MTKHLTSVAECDAFLAEIADARLQAPIEFEQARAKILAELPPGTPTPGDAIIRRIQAEFERNVVLVALLEHVLPNYVRQIRAEFVYAEHITTHELKQIAQPIETLSLFTVTYAKPTPPPEFVGTVFGPRRVKTNLGYDIWDASAGGKLDTNPDGREATAPDGGKVVKRVFASPFNPKGWHYWQCLS